MTKEKSKKFKEFITRNKNFFYMALFYLGFQVMYLLMVRGGDESNNLLIFFAILCNTILFSLLANKFLKSLRKEE